MRLTCAVGAGLLALAVLAPLVFVFAQTSEDGDGSNNRRRGFSSRYQPQINALGATPVASFPIPVLLQVEVADLTKNFGDSRGGGTRTHEGLDILAREGTPIASPTDAVVTRTGNGADSGLYVRTANPGGEQFVYMHLSSVAQGIEAGDIVKRGEIIGFVGNTGNASGGPAHLHFEIRSGGAVDPYPRLTQTFTQAERELSIAEAQAKGIVISQAVLAQLAGKVEGSPPLSPANTTPSYKATLVFGKTNADVVTLQKFLIASLKGDAGARLKNAGATGYFGTLTRDALVEYQLSSGLNASGSVEEATYMQIFALQGEGDSSETEEGNVTIVSGNGPVFARDLEFGMTGHDVRELQKFLNSKGFLVASSGAGSPGNETDYFGSLTHAALVKYQAANGISPAAGYLGPVTRGRIGAM